MLEARRPWRADAPPDQHPHETIVIYVRSDFATAPAEFFFGFGNASHQLFPGDWNADGLDTFAVRRIIK